jgi:anionic cell wall polymer biosynthesis LytR-Cps2A-Psr (LCP) family protein
MLNMPQQQQTLIQILVEHLPTLETIFILPQFLSTLSNQVLSNVLLFIINTIPKLVTLQLNLIENMESIVHLKIQLPLHLQFLLLPILPFPTDMERKS